MSRAAGAAAGRARSPAFAARDWMARWRRRLRSLQFSAPVTHVYNPLEYARAALEQYFDRYARVGVPAVLLGMNPGPWGMAQTGVPFGAVPPVRDWLALDAPIGRPAVEHPARPVQGLACPRSEVSGVRLWGWAERRFGTPEQFFRHFFVANYCPLAFLEASGRNRTPDKLPSAEAAPLTAACDAALCELVDGLRPAWVIGVGAYAARRAQAALGGRDLRFGTILHPSPASPRANQDWEGTIALQLAEMGLV